MRVGLAWSKMTDEPLNPCIWVKTYQQSATSNTGETVHEDLVCKNFCGEVKGSRIPVFVWHKAQTFVLSREEAFVISQAIWQCQCEPVPVLLAVSRRARYNGRQML
jgi:hypothetical protein